MFHIFKTKKPISENTAQLVAVTSDEDRVFDLLDRTNKSQLKTLNKPEMKVNGNREVTEAFTSEELINAGWPSSRANGDIPE